jgi:acetyl-CoA carboxylase carboxyl transferase subunit beta
MTTPQFEIGDDVEPLPGSDALRCSLATIGTTRAVLTQWDFSRHGGSFGIDDANAFVAAVASAIDRRLPLVTVMRSGGTRLREGMRALVGIPRAAIALADLRTAGLLHVSIADHPTTGGVWVAIGSGADIRIGLAGALIGFSGPRVVTAMTGRALPEGASTAESAHAAGLIDVIATPETVSGIVRAALAATAPDDAEPVTAPAPCDPPSLNGDDQVIASHVEARPSGAELAATLLTGSVAISAGDPTVTAAIGRISGRRAVVVALAAQRAAMPGPKGFALLERAATLAGSFDLPLVVLVDTPGADPHTESLGLVPAIANSLMAVLDCPAPTISLVHGEGGSGGALAGAVTDVVGVGRFGWFAALSPEGAAAALRLDVAEAGRLMRITPAELLADGLADRYVEPGTEAGWIASEIDRLRREPVADRLARRRARWSAPLS